MAFHIARARPLRNVISLAPMIDILMILLVFFMVTSTYLDLDMIPAVEQAPDAAAPAAPQADAGTLLIRIAADGSAAVQGRALDTATLTALLETRLAADPLLQIVVLPTGAAPMQALITVMDTATQAGAERIRVVRLEPRP